MNPMKVGLLGLGVVGGGTWAVLARNAEEIVRRAGRRIEVSQIAVRDVGSAQPRRGWASRFRPTALPWCAIRRSDIVVELIGGDTLARELVLEAIAQGKHVVTANKALLAKHGNEIFRRRFGPRRHGGVRGRGGRRVPIIKAIREGLTANRIEWVAGIINGTTNFILSEMRARGLPFADVLAEAQRLGYAEADPTFDIEGVDAAHKLTLLASLAFGVPVQFDKAYVEGITQLAQSDIATPSALGYRIKLLGITKRRVDGIELRVHPTLVPAERLLAQCRGAP